MTQSPMATRSMALCEPSAIVTRVPAGKQQQSVDAVLCVGNSRCWGLGRVVTCHWEDRLPAVAFEVARRWEAPDLFVVLLAFMTHLAITLWKEGPAQQSC
jgi:hypothetical protein